MQEYADNTFVRVLKDMLTFISLTASVFVRNMRGVVVSISPSVQATRVHSRSNFFLLFLIYYSLFVKQIVNIVERPKLINIIHEVVYDDVSLYVLDTFPGSL